MSDATQPNSTPTVEIRAILDTGSQRTYVTTRVKDNVRARTLYSEDIVIKTFGSEWGERRLCDVIHLRIATNDGGDLVLPAGLMEQVRTGSQM